MQLDNLSIELVLLTLSLATWRLASLLASENGPLDIFRRLRYLAGVRADASGRPYYTNLLAKGLICIWCNSVWVGILFTVSYAFWPVMTVWLLLPLALSAGAVFYQTLLNALAHRAH